MGERLKLNSVSGNVVSFDTDLEKNLGSLKIGIEPVQEGSGDPSPDNVRPISGWNKISITQKGKNLLNIPDFEETVYNGVTFSCINGVITANGTATTTSIFLIKPTFGYVKTKDLFDVKPGEYYILSGCKGGKYGESYWLHLLIRGSGIEPRSDDGDSSSFSFTSTQVLTEERQLAIRFLAGTQFNNVKFYPMIRCVSTSNETFNPYITGATYPITLPSAAGTVYGGELDVTKGILTVDRAMVDLGTLTWVYQPSGSTIGCMRSTFTVKGNGDNSKISNIICSIYKTVPLNDQKTDAPLREDKSISSVSNGIFIQILDTAYTDAATFTSAMSGVQLVYELATPQTYSLTPTEISALLGTNILYADCGPIQEASYFSRDYVPIASDTGLITVTDGVEAPIDSLKIHFEPVQEGSGDPSPENVRAISGWSGVEATRTGKNLLNINRTNLVESNTSSNTTLREFTESQIWVGLSYNNYFIRARIDTYINNGEQITVACNSTAYGVAFPCRCRPNTKYTISCKENSKCILCTGFYENNGRYISCASRHASSITITTPDKCEWLTVCLCPEAADNNVTYSNLQFELNLTATDYEPYTGQTYPITFPSEAGTVYGGYVDVAKGELIIDRAITTIGACTWSLNKTYTYTQLFVSESLKATIDKSDPVVSTAMGLECSKFKPIGRNYQYVHSNDQDSTNTIAITIAGNVYIASNGTSTYVDGDAFKNTLADTQIIYPLATPLAYSLTPTQLSTIKGLNNIYSDANGAIEMSYYSPVKENILSARRRSFAWDYKTYIASHPAVLQKLCSTGKASNYFNIGDEIIIPWTDNGGNTPIEYQYPFVVTHFGDVYDENGNLHENGMWLMAKYATPRDIIFDAAERTAVNLAEEPNALEGWYYWGVDDSTYTALELNTGDTIPTTHASVVKCGINIIGVLRYGYNRWKNSAYRQWLNSNAGKNEGWWTEQHIGDRPPAAAQLNLPGWLDGFTNEWKAIFKSVKVDTACNTVIDSGVIDTTYDIFFLPSVEQMYGAPQVAGVEGDYWEYWKNETGLNTPSNGSSSDTNNARKIPSIASPAGSAVNCRLRSAIRSTSNNAWNMNAAGYLYSSTAYSSSRALPACVIY